MAPWKVGVAHVPAVTVPELTPPNPLTTRAAVWVTPTVGVPLSVAPAASGKVIPAMVTDPERPAPGALKAVTGPQMTNCPAKFGTNPPDRIKPVPLSVKLRHTFGDSAGLIAVLLVRVTPGEMPKVSEEPPLDMVSEPGVVAVDAENPVMVPHTPGPGGEAVTPPVVPVEVVVVEAVVLAAVVLDVVLVVELAVELVVELAVELALVLTLTLTQAVRVPVVLVDVVLVLVLVLVLVPVVDEPVVVVHVAVPT